MKIIALLPFKNEAWVLPSYLSSVTRLADQIIGLDDGSTDQSAALLQEAGATIVSLPSPKDAPIAMSTRRQTLLELGREAGGTHFIWLDADETFTAPFIKKGKEIIAQMKPGEKLCMDWLTLWKDPRSYRVDTGSIWSNNKKDFIVYDQRDYGFEERFLSEGRTEGPNTKDNTVYINREVGAVLHFQFADFTRFQWKQARYRALELIKQPHNALEINRLYSITLDDPRAETTPLKQEWTEGIVFPTITKNTEVWYRTELFSLFKRYGITFFEPLQIWHIKELYDAFMAEVGREPKPLIPRITLRWKILSTIRAILPPRLVRRITALWKNH